MLLTDVEIRKKKFLGKKIKLSDGNGLYLFILKKSKRWYLKYSFRGKRIERPLGKYPDLPLLQARKIALEAQIALSNGIDPFAAKASLITFAEAFEVLFAIEEKRYAKDTMDNRRNRYERYIKNVIGDLPLDEVTPQHVLNIVLPEHDKGHEATAKRLRIIIGQVYRDGMHRYGLTFDPSQGSQRLKKKKRVKHHQHIEDKRILGRLMADLERGNPRCSPEIQFAMKLLPYVFSRPYELRHAKTKDFSLDEKVWRIYDGKMQRLYLIPLANQVVDMIGEYLETYQGGDDDFFLPSRDSDSGMLSGNTMEKYLKRLGYGSDIITPHGFRGTATTILHEKGYDKRWIDKQLDHKLEDEVDEAYNHARFITQRTEMMQVYADYLDELKLKYGMS